MDGSGEGAPAEDASDACGGDFEGAMQALFDDGDLQGAQDEEEWLDEVCEVVEAAGVRCKVLGVHLGGATTGFGL
eukprot:SAG22_NODE_15531_length_346_cov_1.255061_1_plen_74_part_01